MKYVQKCTTREKEEGFIERRTAPADALRLSALTFSSLWLLVKYVIQPWQD
jgi:hypothetical protein